LGKGWRNISQTRGVDKGADGTRVQGGDSARPVGEGKYAIINHKNHAELAYILEMPKEPGEAQKELGIEKEASYIVSVINPKVPVTQGYPSAEQAPQYSQFILATLENNENFVQLSKDIRLLITLMHK
jgi:hypothetical protein